MGIPEIKVLLGCCGSPPEDKLNRLWEEHKSALLSLLKHSSQGLRGNYNQTKNIACYLASRAGKNAGSGSQALSKFSNLRVNFWGLVDFFFWL